MDSFCYGRISSFGASDSSTFRLSVEDQDLLFETSQVQAAVPLSPCPPWGCLSRGADPACPLCPAGGRDRPAPQHVPRLSGRPATAPAPRAGGHQPPSSPRTSPGALPHASVPAAPAARGLVAQLAQWPAQPHRVLPMASTGGGWLSSKRWVCAGPPALPAAGGQGLVLPMPQLPFWLIFLNLFRDACVPHVSQHFPWRAAGPPCRGPPALPPGLSPFLAPRCLCLQHSCCPAALPRLLPPPGGLCPGQGAAGQRCCAIVCLSVR